MKHEVLVRVVHGRAHVYEKAQSSVYVESIPVAVVGEWHPVHEFDDEVWKLPLGYPSVEQLRDVGM